MKKLVFISILVFSSLLSTAQTERPNSSVGFEVLGNSGLYSIVFNKTVFSANSYHLEIRPQLSVVPGSLEGGIANHLVATFGLTNRYGWENFWFTGNISISSDYSWGAESLSPRAISAVTIGPKLRTSFATFGLGYTYFIIEPTFFQMSSYPSSISLSLEVEIGG